jgi:quinoprotein relay system zinc metallohydrolase 1
MVTRRHLVAGALALPLAARASILGAQQFAGTYAPVAHAVGDGIWLVRGADDPIEFANGGAIANSIILASDAGAIAVDPGPSLAFGKALDALARQVTGKPVTRIYLTNLHPDRSFGNVAFKHREIHALPQTTAGLERDGPGFADAMYRLLGGWMTGTEVVLPTHDAVSGPISYGGRELELFDLSGHTEGDLALLDKPTGSLIAGGLVFHNRAPATPHANLAAWQSSLGKLETIPHRQLLPGHGPLDPQGQAIAQTRDWLIWIEDALRSAVVGGLDMTEASNIPIPQRFADVRVARYEIHRSVSHFYPALEAELLPRIDG